MATNRLVYYDTNIWVGYMLGSKDRHYVRCKALVENIKNGKKVAIVSYLVMMETIHVLRERVVARGGFIGDDRNELDSKRTSAEIISEEFTQRISEMER